MKTCHKCGLTKPVEEFAINRSRPDGRHNMCKPCKNAYNVTYYAKTKTIHNPARRERTKRYKIELKQFILNYLRNHPCVDCGETDVVVLEFDHQRDKVANISTMIAHGRSLKRVEEEIAKCEVVCANDHRRRTAKMFGSYRSPVSLIGRAGVS